MVATLSNNLLFKVKSPENTEIIGGWAGDTLDKFGGWTDEQLQKLGDAITTGIYNGFVSIMGTVADFVNWGSRVGIMFCIISYIVAKDRKSVALGVKLALIYLITTVVMSKL